ARGRNRPWCPRCRGPSGRRVRRSRQRMPRACEPWAGQTDAQGRSAVPSRRRVMLALLAQSVRREQVVLLLMSSGHSPWSSPPMASSVRSADGASTAPGLATRSRSGPPLAPLVPLVPLVPLCASACCGTTFITVYLPLSLATRSRSRAAARCIHHQRDQLGTGLTQCRHGVPECPCGAASAVCDE